ncbi:hypothetical protein HEP74_00254 [Xanthomonas sp. SS]|uniref:ATP-binding protein n=1 Tax=Xanthomonas sp. SS TaxID=2724122 RepID=UPI00163993DE|nr:ATP-binding protein [Xanthomonas sp. SS]QNH15136.1 hypothetical protein HEP74_00254 [Xanthomonas sp. SS]
MLPSNMLIRNDDISGIVSRLGARDIVLWVRKPLLSDHERDELARFVGLPWAMVVSEDYDDALVAAIQNDEGVDNPLVRRRGFVQIIESDISKVDLPTRSLPLLFLGGSARKVATQTFADKMRRMAMLDFVRTSDARHILAVGGETAGVPEGIGDIWGASFQPSLTVVSPLADAGEVLSGEVSKFRNITLVSLGYEHFMDEVISRYSEVFPPDHVMVRLRDKRGNPQVVDLTLCDEPERPVLEDYNLIQERDLRSIMPDELTGEAFADFFSGKATRWEPYAAGLPWSRGETARHALKSLLHKLDSHGPDANVIGYITSEPGAGGTTLAHALAWEAARDGYPVLVAKSLPFEVSALPLVHFMHRAKDAAAESSVLRSVSVNTISDHELYETPWVIVFDVMHWQHRASELLSFFQEVKRSGRPTLILVVADVQLPLAYHNHSIFKPVANVLHLLSSDAARDLGRHLNKFLSSRGLARSEAQWTAFFNAHAVGGVNDSASFWVALSFWVRGQYDLNESLQEWIFSKFISGCPDDELKLAVMEIASLSAERVPMPEGLLHRSSGKWPTSALLGDARSDLAAVGLISMHGPNGRHWALVHDVLGTYLLNAIFYDDALLGKLSLTQATSPEHLRLILLGQIAVNFELGERRYRALGEDFATTFLKIDPDHGHFSFAPFWREALSILNKMPSPLRDSSRVFRHHTAISRRRIAKLGVSAGVEASEKVEILRQAVTDLLYAIDFIDQNDDSESDLNLLNSLANAYFDLAAAQAELGDSGGAVHDTRKLGYEFAARAHALSPANPFVIETHVKSLLERAAEDDVSAPALYVEALNVLFAAAESKDVQYRRDQLAKMADQALNSLLTKHATASAGQPASGAPSGPVDVLVAAWISLASTFEGVSFFNVDAIDPEELDKALAILENTAGAGNSQVIRLTFDLVVRREPLNFDRQLQLLNELIAVGYRLPAQLQLDRAVLLYQVGRAAQGEREFKNLRNLWRTTEQYVSVPDRLRWLLTHDRKERRVIDAVAVSGYGARAVAKIGEFNNSQTPYRPEEHALRDPKPGLRFKAYVSFGNNGPFLRPLTAPWTHF